jgi:hypothetical protein
MKGTEVRGRLSPKPPGRKDFHHLRLAVLGLSGLERWRGNVEEATYDEYDNQEETYGSEGEGDSSSFISARSAWSSMSRSIKGVGRAIRKRFNRKGLKKARAELGVLENNADMRLLDSYRPLFPHHRPDPRLNQVYDDLCRLSGLAINSIQVERHANCMDDEQAR